MRLVHMEHDIQVEIEENKSHTIVIESPTVFRKLVEDFLVIRDGQESPWVLSQDGSIIPIVKKLDTIINPYDLDINQRKFLTQLFKEIEDHILQTDVLTKWYELMSATTVLMDEVLDENVYEIEYNSDITIKDFLKLVNVKFSNIGDNVTEKILEYVLLANQILKIDVFVFVNLKTYLEIEELNLLMQRLRYEKIHVIMLENTDRMLKCDEEQITVMDCDHCIIHK